MTQLQTVITHDGCFHTDEVVASMLLDLYFNGIDLIRTRDENIINNTENAIIVDVGGRYDGIRRFDHHQYPNEHGFSERWEPTSKVPLSSAGMVWKHFGERLIKKIFPDTSNDDVNKIYIKMYNNFFMEIDANDNGVDQYPSNIVSKKIFPINATLIGTIGRFNGTNVYNSELQYDLFLEAMEFAETMFLIHLQSYYRNQKKLNEEKIIMLNYFNNRLENGKIIIVEEDISNWRILLKELDTSEELLYLVYPREEQWGVKAVSKIGFQARKDLAPENVLESIVGKELIFAHKKRFMCTCRSKDAAIKCAIASVNYEEMSENEIPNNETSGIKSETNDDANSETSGIKSDVKSEVYENNVERLDEK